MEFRARDHVRGLTAILSVLSLALVFGAVLGAIPRAAIPQASDGVLNAIPHVNAAIGTVAIVTILSGVRFVRRGEVEKHQRMMLTSFALFATFLVLYLYKVVVQGTTPFPGPQTVYQFVYLPTLAIHILLAIVCVPIVYYVLLLALTRPISEVFGTKHARFGRLAASLWLISFVLGNVVYFLLYVVY
ncbi:MULTISPECIES: DUF420 domain-containing protein [Haloferax]|uniref:DUF420 domain-containing protein n=2 Tax=Haloferax TaxID=2251 RepID=A0A6G1Z355_9EURY|nr:MULTISPECIES: DUF420 domain-containing protein [Haloferax]KAB1188062.1 DUF420 domain-containing protein [Haloferax sp. CBA1149]MRW80734.1 DUF420 domain-containing protein [Haloferax marinisediminis]